jgi:hypothetical protein
LSDPRVLPLVTRTGIHPTPGPGCTTLPGSHRTPGHGPTTGWATSHPGTHNTGRAHPGVTDRAWGKLPGTRQAFSPPRDPSSCSSSIRRRAGHRGRRRPTGHLCSGEESREGPAGRTSGRTSGIHTPHTKHHHHTGALHHQNQSTFVLLKYENYFKLQNSPIYIDCRVLSENSLRLT